MNHTSMQHLISLLNNKWKYGLVINYYSSSLAIATYMHFMYSYIIAHTELEIDTIIWMGEFSGDMTGFVRPGHK